MGTTIAPMRALLAIVGMALVQSTVAADLHVPSVYPTIQRAIDAALPGDWVTVAPGTYRENLYITKSVMIRSTRGADSTALDGGATGPVVVAWGTGAEYIAIVGFKITNGRNTFDNPNVAVAGFGGAMSLNSVVAYVANNDIVGNVGCVAPGVNSSSSSVAIINNRIRDNPQDPSCASVQGGGIFINDNGPFTSSIVGNEISGHRSGSGSGIFVNYSTGIQIRSNKITNNTTTEYGMGAGMSVFGSATIVDNIISNNSNGSFGDGAGAVFGPGDPPNRIVFSDNTLKDNVSDNTSAVMFFSYYLDQVVFNKNVIRGSSTGPLLNCVTTYPFDIDRSNKLVNQQGPLVGGYCITQ